MSWIPRWWGIKQEHCLEAVSITPSPRKLWKSGKGCWTECTQILVEHPLRVRHIHTVYTALVVRQQGFSVVPSAFYIWGKRERRMRLDHGDVARASQCQAWPPVLWGSQAHSVSTLACLQDTEVWYWQAEVVQVGTLSLVLLKPEKNLLLLLLSLFTMLSPEKLCPVKRKIHHETVLLFKNISTFYRSSSHMWLWQRDGEKTQPRAPVCVRVHTQHTQCW